MSDLQITAACQPAPFGEDLQTLGCGGSLTNTGAHLLTVVAIGITPGKTEADVLEYELVPQATALLPAPPAGGVWVLGAETSTQMRRRSDWTTVGAITVGALSGVGTASVLLAGIAAGAAAVKRHRDY